MAVATSMAATGEQSWSSLRAQFLDDGVVIIRGLLTPADLQPLKDDLAELTRNVAKKRGVVSPQPVGCFETDVAKLEAQNPGFGAELHSSMRLTSATAALWSHPQLLEVVRQLTAWDEVAAHPSFNIRPKAPDTAELNYGMHQDHAFWGEQSLEADVVACWLPLVPVNRENGTLQLICGSHHGGLRQHYLTEDGSYAPFIPEHQFPEGKRVLAELQPGDALFFCPLVIHGGCGPNRSNSVRWAVDFRWQNGKQPDFLTGSPDGIMLHDGKGPLKVDVEQWGQRVEAGLTALREAADWHARWTRYPSSKL